MQTTHASPLTAPGKADSATEQNDNVDAWESWKREQNSGTLQKIKNVGTGAGLALLINNLTGPGLSMVCELYQQSGWFWPTVFFVFACGLSTFASLVLIEAMQNIPGNRHFQGSVEFSTLLDFYLGRQQALLGQFILFASLQAFNIASIGVCFQQLDSFIIDVFGKSCALTMSLRMTCSSGFPAGSNSAFGDAPILFSFGTILTILSLNPLAALDMDDNIKIQVATAIAVLVIVFQWMYSFSFNRLDTSLVPFWKGDVQQVPGLVLANYAFVATIPSWINAKEKSVNVQRSLWTATIGSTVLYILLGILGAMALPNASNLLVALTTYAASPFLRFVSKISGYIFTIAVIMSGIPATILILKANLIQANLASEKVASFAVYTLPICIAAVLQSGNAITSFTNFTSLTFGAVANLILPFIVFLASVEFRRKYDVEKHLTDDQRELLKSIHVSSRSIQRFLERGDTHSFKILAKRLEKKDFARINTGETLSDSSLGRDSQLGSLRRRKHTGEKWAGEHSIDAVDAPLDVHVEDLEGIHHFEDLEGIHHFPALEKFLTKDSFKSEATDGTEYPHDDIPAPLPDVSSRNSTLPRNPLYTGPQFHLFPDSAHVDAELLAKRSLWGTSLAVGFCIISLIFNQLE